MLSDGKTLRQETKTKTKLIMKTEYKQSSSGSFKPCAYETPADERFALGQVRCVGFSEGVNVSYWTGAVWLFRWCA